MRRPRPRAAAVLGVLALAVGCAELQDPIDRTEANVLPKSLFTGEWYYSQTVVEVPGTNTFTMVGNTSYRGMHRVRWDVQRDWLYARKSYEHVDGAKGVDEDSGEYKGSIVGAWKILSHFDVKRDYNPRTGEENNVIQENDSDCKWYDCTHMRVDWSKNHAIDYNFLDSAQLMDRFEKEPVPFYYEDAADPRFKPIFDETAGYIDVTTAMAVKPPKFSFNYHGHEYSFPACLMFSGADSECTTQIVKVRNSFLRRHPNRDFQPRTHMGKYSEWFGFFTNDRLKWLTEVGVTQKNREDMINRHNIWIHWHYDAKTGPEACQLKDKSKCKEAHICTNATAAKEAKAQDALCAKRFGAGSVCDELQGFHSKDVWTDSDADGLPDTYEKIAGLDTSTADSDKDGIVDKYDDKDGNGKADLYDYFKWARETKEYHCTIPLQKRTPRPIGYFNPGDFPRDLECDKTDKGKGACCAVKKDGKCVNTWTIGKYDAKSQKDWSVLHKVSNDYDNTWWHIFLRGAYGWSYDAYKAWVDTHNPNHPLLKDKHREDLARFGDIKDPTGPNRPVAWTICPNNPVQDSDPWPCRFNHKSWDQAKKLIDEGMDKASARPIVRAGDIRFSQVHYVKDYYSGIGLLGLGPSHTDPRTGENISGVANVYALNDWAANYVREMVQLLNGDISPTQYVDGVDLKNWLQQVKAKNGSYAADHNRMPRSYDYKDLNQTYKSMVQPWMKRVARLGTPKQIEKMRNAGYSNAQVERMLIEATARSGVFDPSKTRGGIDMIKGTNLEKRLIDEEVLMASGYEPPKPNNPLSLRSMNLSDAVLNKASLSRGGFIPMLEAQQKMRYQLANQQNMYFAEMADDAMIGLAHRLKDRSKEEIYLAARDIIMRAVLSHELGHTMGLHHNWGGSEDVMNFHPGYWKLRTNNFQDTEVCTGPWTSSSTPAPRAGDHKLCPFYIKGKEMNDFQRGLSSTNSRLGLRSMYEYAYSSVMDYAGRYTIDGNGLGRYDRAALTYGHVDKVEVFKKRGPEGQASLSLDLFHRWFDTDANPLLFTGAGPGSFHYTQLYAYMKKNLYDPKNRRLVDYHKVEWVNESGQNGVTGWFLKSGSKKDWQPRVPYVFCTWTRGDISDGCNTRDYGSDQYERMKQHVDGWRTWYPMHSFTRYRFGASPSHYIRRYWRMYHRLKDFNNTYALYQTLFRQYYTDAQINAFFTDPINGWGAYTVAMKDAFNMALRTLAMPDVKYFKDKSAEPGGETLYAEADLYAKYKSDISNSRYFATSWSDTNYNRDFGLKWWRGLHHYGFYLDKIMAMFALIDPNTYFVARDTAENIRKWRISFFDNFSTQLIDFFGAVLSKDYKGHAPMLDPNKTSGKTVRDSNGVKWTPIYLATDKTRAGGAIALRDYATRTTDGKSKFAQVKDVAVPKGGAPLEPATRFTLQMYMAIYGFLVFHNNFDNQYTERATMWKKGTGYGWEVKPTKEVDGTVEFLDPYSGLTYVGAKYKDGRGIAQRMIAHANKLKARSSKYCNQNPGLADSCSTQSDSRADGALYEYRQLMDVIVNLSQRYWKNWNWNPFNP